ncbi:fructose-6-phosphate aldolase [Actinotalea sp. M2MS4P-6]|uniref:fructose-6-phosphate aldolase n=1 Tax=Actinotalea sp. M2MS4P-6 TaxID=2983762 RepID=UPI0021E39F9A|nr:fructose-6-phosphate aldolase [Actinotalea sp. M2MS4P-6]MCV2394272.1 fructose-6-phosphate aldolase [Actinotalea sp. M2MS4P-6]
MFDTTNLADIERFGEVFPYTGVTSNPTILKRDGQREVLATFREIRRIIGAERSLHVQVVATDRDDMVKEAETILRKVDEAVYVKVPTTEEGLAAMQILKRQGVGVTATAVYTKLQGFMAIAAGADFIAPYYNRVANLDVNARELIGSLAEMIDRHGSATKILAASFSSIAQVNAALMSGAHVVTVAPRLLHDAYSSATLERAVADFADDWRQVAGDTSIAAL